MKIGIENLEQSCRGNIIKIARVFIERSEDSKRACAMLREVGFVVNTVPVVGMWGPVAFIEGRLYEGLPKIKEYIKSYRREQQTR